MRTRRIVVKIQANPHRDRWAKRCAETPKQTADRLIREMGGVEAINIARDRAWVHAPVAVRRGTEPSIEQLAALEDHEAKRSTESFARWVAVVRYLKGRLTDTERRAVGLPPRQPTGRPAS